MLTITSDDVLYDDNIQEKIKNTDTYKECRGEYLKYLRKLAIFLKKLGITKDLDVSIFFQVLLDNGYLSINKKHKYSSKLTKRYIERKILDIYEIEDILGCRILTGESVCRHTSAFLVDLQNTLGNISCNLGVIGMERFKSNKINKYLNNNNSDHQIIASIDEYNTIIGYCPTNRNIIELTATNDYIYGKATHTIITNEILEAYNKNNSRDTICYNKNKLFHGIAPYQYPFYYFSKESESIDNNPNSLKEKNLIFNNNIKKRNLIIEDLYKIYDYIEELDIRELDDFYNQTEDQIYKLSDLLNKTMPPLTRRKVKTFQIR